MLFFEVWKGIPIDCAKYKNNSQTFWWNFPILFPNFRAQCSGTVVSENSPKENPCVVFVVDIYPAVLWLLFRFPTLNTMGVLLRTISSLTEAKNATIETTFFVEVSESLSLMPWLALLLLVLASGYHHEKKSFCHCPNLISVVVHSKNIIRNIHKPT